MELLTYEELVYTVDYQHASTPSSSDGIIDITIISGNTPIEIIWNNSSTDFSLTNLFPGTYYYTLTDANMCEIIDSVVISDEITVESINQIYDSSFCIYPNPFTDIISIKSDNLEITDVKIYDISGKIIIEVTQFSENVSIDLSMIPSGIYLIEIMNGNEKRWDKIIKQK